MSMLQEDLYFHGVKALIMNDDDRVLLLQANAARLRNWTGEPYRDLPGGRVCRGVSLSETLEREINEEIGKHQVVIRDCVGVVLSNIRIPYEETDYGLFLSVYRCGISPDPIVLSEEHQTMGWFDLEQAAALLSVKYPVALIDQIKSYKNNL